MFGSEVQSFQSLFRVFKLISSKWICGVAFPGGCREDRTKHPTRNKFLASPRLKGNLYYAFKFFLFVAKESTIFHRHRCVFTIWIPILFTLNSFEHDDTFWVLLCKKILHYLERRNLVLRFSFAIDCTMFPEWQKEMNRKSLIEILQSFIYFFLPHYLFVYFRMF